MHHQAFASPDFADAPPSAPGSVIPTRANAGIRACHAAACCMLFIQTLYFFDVIEVFLEPSSGLNRFIMFTSLGTATVLAMAKLPITLKVLRIAWPIAPLIIWYWMTAFWSDAPDLVRQRSTAFAVAYVSALGIAVGMRTPRGLVITLAAAAFVVIVADLTSLAFPDTSHSEIGIKGIHVHKNVAGFVAIVCGTILAFAMTQLRNPGVRTLFVLMMILAFVFLIMTKSKTNFFVLAVLIAMTPVYLLLVRGQSAMKFHFILTCVMCAAIFLIGASGSKLSALGRPLRRPDPDQPRRHLGGGGSVHRSVTMARHWIWIVLGRRR